MVNWDKRYAEAGTRLFGGAPNEYLRQIMARSDVNPANVLCLADGDGRNGLWLASQGLTVTSVDISAVATEAALASDAEAGVHVTRIVADLADWIPDGAGPFDAVFLFYLQCEEQVRSSCVARAWQALSPGGWFGAEGFSKAGSDRGALGPRDADLRYDLQALIGVLPDARIVEAFDGITWLNEGTKHQGAGHVTRLLARKSA